MVIRCEGKTGALGFPIFFGYCFSALMDCIRAVLNLQEFILERQANIAAAIPLAAPTGCKGSIMASCTAQFDRPLSGAVLKSE